MKRERHNAAQMLIRIGVMACVLLWPAVQSLHAHQQKAAITRVLFNSNSGNLEVMHRFYVHDAEHAVRQLVDPNADLIASAAAREQFAQYVTERFSLLSTEGSTLPLGYVGQEVDGIFLWVYQEMPMPAAITGLSVVNNVLREIWPEQNNLVNIEREDDLQTLNFTGNTEWLSVTFD